MKIKTSKVMYCNGKRIESIRISRTFPGLLSVIVAGSPAPIAVSPGQITNKRGDQIYSFRIRELYHRSQPGEGYLIRKSNSNSSLWSVQFLDQYPNKSWVDASRLDLLSYDGFVKLPPALTGDPLKLSLTRYKLQKKK